MAFPYSGIGFPQFLQTVLKLPTWFFLFLLTLEYRFDREHLKPVSALPPADQSAKNNSVNTLPQTSASPVKGISFSLFH